MLLIDYIPYITLLSALLIAGSLALTAACKTVVNTLPATSKLIKHKRQLSACLSSCDYITRMLFVINCLLLLNSPYNIFAEYCSLWSYDFTPIIDICIHTALTIWLTIFISEFSSQTALYVNKENFIKRHLIYMRTVFTLLRHFTPEVNRRQTDNSEINGAVISSVDDKEILHNILTFGDIEVKEIMTPRHEIYGIEKKENFFTLKKMITDGNYSRIPVYEDNIDNVFGIIYVKDLLKYIKENIDFNWTKLIRRIYFVPENKKISNLLHEFQTKKIHMAAVCDEYGGISGLITMEDILEEIVGEISDEFDSDELPDFQKISENIILFNGKILLNDFYKAAKLPDTFFDPIKGDAESLAGVMLEIKGEFPKKGDNLEYKNLKFKIESFANRRIEKIRVQID